MNNLNNCLGINKINAQLERAEIQKGRLIRNIYVEYELYLNLVRNLLYISVKKGFNELISYPSIKDNSLNANELFCFFEKKISKLIYKKLPLITVEQLKINNIEKNIDKDINFNTLRRSTKIYDNQKEESQDENGSQFDIPLQFHISEDISNTKEYYQAENHEKSLSFDLDKNYHANFLYNNNFIENAGIEKQFISSMLELIKEVKVVNPRHSENQNINQIDIFTKDLSLKNFDLIDKSLENLLLNLSFKINQELFKANLIKNMISQDSFEYLVGKKLMIKHPRPFVINFEFNINQSALSGENIPTIIFLNISTVELEFKNLKLSIQRNKINDLRNQFQRLIKKEKYWRQKEITFNKIH